MTTTQRNSRRMIVAVVVYLLAGAVTTIAVAWAIVFTTDYFWPADNQPVLRWRPLTTDSNNAIRIVMITRWTKRGFVLTQCFAGKPASPLPADTMEASTAPPMSHWCETCRKELNSAPNLAGASDFPYGRGWTRNITESGWPMLAMWCEPHMCFQTGRWNIEQKTFGGIPTFNDGFNTRTLPLLPRWPGFLFNTLFYACIWFTLIFGLSRSRRLLRKRRGRCPMCAYRLADARSGCSECGWGRAS